MGVMMKLTKEQILAFKIEALEYINDDDMTRPETRERNKILIEYYKKQL